MQREVYASLAHQSEQLGADVIAIGGISDHVHLLVRFPTTVAVSEIVRRTKGATSHLITHVRSAPEPFKWQGGYGAFTVSRRNVPAVRAYVLGQEAHHRDGTLNPALERTTL